MINRLMIRIISDKNNHLPDGLLDLGGNDEAAEDRGEEVHVVLALLVFPGNIFFSDAEALYN